MFYLLLLFEAINLYYRISINTRGVLKPTYIDELWVQWFMLHVSSLWFQPKIIPVAYPYIYTHIQTALYKIIQNSTKGVFVTYR
jgi:hypothetical protein